MGLTKTAITRPIFIFMLMAAAFILGTISYRSMRVEQNPEVSFPYVTVTTIYPGAGPEEMNNLVSRKIEEALSGVNGLYEITSSSSEGVSSVVAQFELNIDSNVALNDVKSKVDAALNELPQDAEKPQVSKIDFTAQPVLTLAFSSPTLDSQQLRDLIDDKIRDRFAQIGGVASASVQGGDVREIQVQLKRDKLLSYGLGINEIQGQIASASVNVPGGRIVNGPLEYTVRVPAEFDNPQQIRDMVLKVSDPNNPMGKAKLVKLSDVADVVDTVVERTNYSRLNGQDTIILAISKAREGNSIEITKAAKDVITQIQKEYAPQGLQIVTTYEDAKHISDSLRDLNFDLAFAIVLVAAIVFIFLHNMRGTILVALAIPFSIFTTFIALKVFGFTINNMTMLAMTLAVGVLVDDAIVVLENIYRHLKMGEDPREAAINGRGEIGLAAIAISLADVVVFLPIANMGGILGRFFQPMAIGYVCAVLVSLFSSFTLTPMLASRWYKAGEDMEHPHGWFATWFEKNFAKLEKTYRRSLEWALRRRWFVFLAGNTVLFAVFMFIAGSFAPGDPKNSWLANAVAAGFMSKGPQGPPMPAPSFIMFFVAIFVGLIVFAINYLRGRGNARFNLALSVGAIVVGIAIASLRGMSPFLGVFIGLLLLGLVTLIMNVVKPYARTRILAQAAAFGLMLPLAAMVGSGVAQWKGESVFKFQFFPDSDSGQVNVNIELPPGSSLAVTEATVARIEKVLSQDPEVKYTVSTIGSQGVGGFGGGNSGSNYAQISASLLDKASVTDKIFRNPEKLRYRDQNTVVADFTRAIGRVPGARVTVSGTGGVGFGSPIQISFTSDNRQLLLETVSNIRARLQDGVIKGVINPDISSKPGKIEQQIVPDRTLVADAGQSIAQAAGAISTLYQGNNQTKLRTLGKEYDVRVMMSPDDRNNPANLELVPIAFNQGQPVYLSNIAKVQQKPGVTRIDRRNREEEVRVTADLLPGYAAGTVQLAIDNWLKNDKMVPEGVIIKPLGQADFQNRESGFLFGAMGIGLVLVYMLLASLYDNLLYPFIIQIAQPQAMVGALLALMITNKSLSIVGMIGMVTLIGLVGKNAILLVDYTNTLRGRGRNRHDALVEAGPTRLRPILMTTLALILGTSPIALALGRGSEFRETLGITIIGGITLSTLLTLLVIPCSYTIFDDLSIWISRKMHRQTTVEGSQEGITRGDTESIAKPEPVA